MKRISAIFAVLLSTSSLMAYTIEVTPGWQLLGAVETIPTTSFDKEGIHSVWTYDKVNHTWRLYVPNNQFNIDYQRLGIEPLDCIEQGDGFWVFATQNVVIDVNTTTPTTLPTLITDNNLTLTTEQTYEVAYMWNEEKLAHDLYLNLFELYSSEAAATPLYNIVTRSEIRHMESVEELLQKYDLDATNVEGNFSGPYDAAALSTLGSGTFSLSAIQSLYDQLYEKGAQSLQDALEVGCIVEVTDVDDLDYALEIAGDNQDLINVFTFLRQGSYNHYWAFDNALKSIGVTDGCCSLGATYCKTPEEYPTSNRNGHN